MEKPPRITKELEAKALGLLRMNLDFSKSHPTVMKLLRELESLGLLTSVQQGRRKLAFVLADTEISL